MIRLALKLLPLLLPLTLLTSCKAPVAAQVDTPARNLIIYYEPEDGNTELLKAARQYGSQVLYFYKNINGIAVTVPKGKTTPEATRYYEKIKGVLSVTEDKTVFPD